MPSRAKCGCYNGPFSKDMMPRTLVSIRCYEHAKVPHVPGHSLMVLDHKGRVVKTTPRDKLDGFQSSSLKEITNRKRYE